MTNRKFSLSVVCSQDGGRSTFAMAWASTAAAEALGSSRSAAVVANICHACAYEVVAEMKFFS